MRLDVRTAAIGSLLFILIASVAAGTTAGAWNIVTLPTINPMLVALVVSGLGLLAALVVMYKTYA